jgi:AraC-like DNA-binding protein
MARIMSLLSLLAAIQGIFLASVLWLHPGNRFANRWLAAALAAYSLVTLGDVLVRSASIERLPHLIYVFDWLLLLVGPLTYRYVLALTSTRRWRWRQMLLHALPALVLLLLFAPFYVLPGNEKLQLLRHDLAAPTVDPLVALMALQVLGYWLAGWLQLRRFRAQLESEYSNLDALKVGWLNALLIANALLWCAWMITLLSGLRLEWLESIVAPLAIYGLGYLGLRHPSVFGVEPVAVASPTPLALPSPIIQKYARSALSSAQLDEFRQRLDQFVQLEKPFLENELTLAELARRVELSPHQLSQLLSVGYQQNFYDFINSQRVAEVKRCLKDPAYARQSVLDIALAAGFSSKASFNTAFKKHTGQTPSAYRSGSNTV